MHLELLVHRQDLALVPAVHGELRGERLWAAFPFPQLLDVGQDVPPKLPCGEAVHHRIQNAVQTHEQQRDLVRVVERLTGLLAPGHVAPALLDLQHRQCPGALDDVVGQETHHKDPHHRQQHLQGPALDAARLLGGLGLAGAVQVDRFGAGRKQSLSNEEITHQDQREDHEEQGDDGKVGGGHRLLLWICLVLVALEAADDLVLVCVGGRIRQIRSRHGDGQRPDDDADNDAAQPVVRGGGVQRPGHRPVPVDADGPQEEDGAVGVDEEERAREPAHEVGVDPVTVAAVVADPKGESAHKQEVGDGEVGHVDADLAHGLGLPQAAKDDEHVHVGQEPENEDDAVGGGEE